MGYFEEICSASSQSKQTTARTHQAKNETDLPHREGVTQQTRATKAGSWARACRVGQGALRESGSKTKNWVVFV